MVDVAWNGAKPISPGEICVCSRDILTHGNFMTGHIQTRRRCTLRIRRLWQNYNGRSLARTILLLDEYRLCHVVARIEIALTVFPPQLKRYLIESDFPFGTILREAGIDPVFSRRQYFRLSEVLPEIPVLPYRRCCPDFFGRSHEMTDTRGRRLASVYEVLP